MAALPNLHLQALPWYDLLTWEAPSVTEPASPQLPPPAPARSPPTTLTQLCGELVLRHLLEAEGEGGYLPAVDLFACPRQLPYLEAATMAAFRILTNDSVLLALTSGERRHWERLPAELRELLHIIMCLQRAEGVSTFMGTTDPLPRKEVLACVAEGLRERHERLWKAMSEIVHRLVIKCLPASEFPDLQNLDTIIWECATGCAVLKFLNALKRHHQTWEYMECTRFLTYKVYALLDTIFSQDEPPMADVADAERSLDPLLQLEEGLQRSMSIVRTIWKAHCSDSAEDGQDPTRSPLQDAAFLQSVHGKRWRSKHSDAYLRSFDESEDSTFQAAFTRVAPLHGIAMQ
mmetsp:Transcript_37168/g.93428  ORF Transcript_37168/g.93428 Transcript_37168/m.93428 type:complete len:347 (-) Transcript_37168:71-1111(-)